MARTAQLALPLILPAQAQKHVTVNEALALLDAAAQLRVISSTLQTPPVASTDGASYLVPGSAVGAWQGKSGQIAVWSNGGWVFLTPRAGWQAWDESLGARQIFDGTAWVVHAVVVSSRGTATTWQIVEFDHTITTGSTNVTTTVIPKQTQVLGVTARVLTAFTGTGLTGWRVGVSGSADRYGTGLGKSINSFLVGLSGSPVTYYADTPLLITGEGGSLAGGKVRFAIHLLQILPPRAV